MAPTVVSFGIKVHIVKVVCGHSHSLALSLIGDVYSWGLNSNGCLGYESIRDEEGKV